MLSLSIRNINKTISVISPWLCYPQPQPALLTWSKTNILHAQTMYVNSASNTPDIPLGCTTRSCFSRQKFCSLLGIGRNLERHHCKTLSSCGLLTNLLGHFNNLSSEIKDLGDLNFIPTFQCAFFAFLGLLHFRGSIK